MYEGEINLFNPIYTHTVIKIAANTKIIAFMIRN